MDGRIRIRMHALDIIADIIAGDIHYDWISLVDYDGIGGAFFGYIRGCGVDSTESTSGRRAAVLFRQGGGAGQERGALVLSKAG
jgi:hypothetical protein